jgi:hypothetical protein
MFLFFKRLLSVLALIMFITISLKAQSITQTVRGKIGDRESNTLPGANVVAIESDLTIDNERAITSARAFTVEEPKRYDGLFNDPTRMVSGYALDDGPTFQKNLFIKNISLKSVAFRRAVIAPVLFTAAGLSTLADDNDDDYEVQGERNKYIPNFRHRADDYLQHAPIMIVYGLNWLGVEGKNDFANRTAILIKSEMMVGILTFSLKRITAVPRPDTRELTSFPSGHTAQAFAAATFMAREYGHKNIWYSIGAYTVATGVGAMRVMNNRHWISDVMVGAGIGILSTNLAYLTHQYRWGKKNKGNQTTVMPSYDGQTGMVNIIHRIN